MVYANFVNEERAHTNVSPHYSFHKLGWFHNEACHGTFILGITVAPSAAAQHNMALARGDIDPVINWDHFTKNLFLLALCIDMCPQQGAALYNCDRY